MDASITLLKRVWTGLRRLHLALYFLFAMMMSLGGIIAGLFEQYSIIDFKSGIGEVRKNVEAEQRGAHTPGSSERMREAFKPLDRQHAARPTDARGRKDDGVSYRLADGRTWWPYLLIFLWLWPLYRHNFSSKPPSRDRVERRIVDLPMFLFGLTWLAAAGHYFYQLGVYQDLYGEPDLRVLTSFAVGACLLGAFAGYLNLELTQLYVRRFIARPFFEANNPYALKRGLRVGLTLRQTLMLFSLATVPLALCVYIPVFFNWDLLHAFLETKDSQSFFENAGIFIPLIMTTFIAVLMFCFHGVSLLLYRWNVQRPVGVLIECMRRVAAGRFDGKTLVLDCDEIGQLKGHFNLMLDGLQEREIIKDTFGRYMSIEIAEKIFKNDKVNLAGEEIDATVLFSDIRNFTARSETLAADALVRFLNAYFSHLTPPIMEHSGVINKFMGDAVMAIFSPVFGLDDHVAAAVRAALAMRTALQEFNRSGKHPPVSIGIGIHTGRLIAGSVGTDDRREYTVLGDTVNVASRIEGQTKAQKTDILVSEAVVARLDRAQFADVQFDTCGPVLLRGKSRPMELFRLGNLTEPRVDDPAAGESF